VTGAASSRLPERRVLVLANKPRALAPNQRFRFEQWAPRLERDHGIRLDLVPFESPRLAQLLGEPGHLPAKAFRIVVDFLRRGRVVPMARRYDAVLIVREASLIGPAIYERLLAWTGPPIIYDFDDSIWRPQSEMRHGLLSRLHFHGKTATLCRLASAVSAGNAHLADFAGRHNPSVFIVPTSIELDDYPIVAEPAGDRPFVVGWTGSTSTLAHFEHAREALEAVASRIPLVVKIICNQPPDRPIAGAETRFIPWSPVNEAQEIGDCHAGIMPLPDDEFTRGKCGLKGLQFMATGRPVVMSPVGMNQDLIEHGVNGFLAGPTAEWVGALTSLAERADLRARIGTAARKTVERDYSAEAVAARFARVVRFVTDAQPV
jgi:glycosyltransferase involved in cell wall biosynthesis